MSAHAVLLLSCPDRRGVVAAVADFVAGHDGNIIDAEQHVDEIEGVFFQRSSSTSTGSRSTATRSSTRSRRSRNACG